MTMRLDHTDIDVPWRHTITLEGVTFALRSPLEVDADNAGERPRGVKHWPGLALRAVRRAWSSETSLDRMRRELAPIFASADRWVVERMSGGDVLRVWNIYVALQTAWAEAHRDAALRHARAVHTPADAPAHSPAPPPAPRTPAAQEYTLRRGGGVLPSWMGGHSWGAQRPPGSPAIEI